MRTASIPNSELGTTGPGGVRRGKSAFIRFAKRARPWLNAILSRYSLVGDPPVTDPGAFPWIEDLLPHLPEIRAEADRIMRYQSAVPPFRDFAPGHERIAPNEDDWWSFFFWGYGYPMPENQARCPVTANALAKVPGLVSALYSVVAPGAHIRRHRVVTKAVMTLHICLRAPSEAEKCQMDADGIKIVWREGEAVVIDDTFPHEVWNNLNETRVNLLVQFRRPMRQPGKLLGGAGHLARRPFLLHPARAAQPWILGGGLRCGRAQLDSEAKPARAALSQWVGQRISI
jgi:aspartyl/asparaginyl beta-hydroxylase (cupin superfamily)